MLIVLAPACRGRAGGTTPNVVACGNFNFPGSNVFPRVSSEYVLCPGVQSGPVRTAGLLDWAAYILKEAARGGA
jgi:hypothetical protein